MLLTGIVEPGGSITQGLLALHVEIGYEAVTGPSIRRRAGVTAVLPKKIQRDYKRYSGGRCRAVCILADDHLSATFRAYERNSTNFETSAGGAHPVRFSHVGQRGRGI